jgi:hypothetical protein
VRSEKGEARGKKRREKEKNEGEEVRLRWPAVCRDVLRGAKTLSE